LRKKVSYPSLEDPLAEKGGPTPAVPPRAHRTRRLEVERGDRVASGQRWSLVQLLERRTIQSVGDPLGPASQKGILPRMPAGVERIRSTALEQHAFASGALLEPAIVCPPNNKAEP
jgi:hypothetical protein